MYNDDEMTSDTLAETENYTAWSMEEPDGEVAIHLELGPVTVHFFAEEWEEFVELIREANQVPPEDDEDAVEVELDWGSLFFSREEWTEFVKLIEEAAQAAA